MRATAIVDRLYALSVRPQEWDGLRDRTRLALRWGPVADDPEAPARRHWFLLVIEAQATLPAEDPLAKVHPDGLEVLRAGWEAELELPIELPATAIDADDALVAALAERIAAQVNALAEAAGVAPLLPPAMVTELCAALGGGLP